MGDELKNIVLVIESYFFYAVALLMPLFAIVALVNRLRVPNVRLSVWHGALFGYPLLPTLYAFAQLCCLVIGAFIGNEESVIKFALYFMASVFWFIGASASEQRLLTDEGVVQNVHSPKKSLLRWSEVTDYFVKRKRFYAEYRFFHGKPAPISTGSSKSKSRSKSNAWNVVVIRVPNRQKQAFEAIIREKLEPRFDVDPIKIYRGEFKP
ncbi:MAG: hypothetical protein NZM06_05490 [Chloroherpetonaceae bacterium]|nr:hypothetical protein [Chloroherpetonaceae bacterium]MDW8438078.1 hypothetical protein [Chloroherpetonaceae bacterium]